MQKIVSIRVPASHERDGTRLTTTPEATPANIVSIADFPPGRLTSIPNMSGMPRGIAMIPVKELTNLTGYVRGGCTAIGMKKQFPTILSDKAQSLSDIYVSGGKIGCQMNLSPDDLLRASGGRYGDILVS